MATRNTKTQTAAAAEEVVGTTNEDISFYSTVRDYAKNMGVELPTGRMLIAGTIVQTLVSVVGGIYAVQLSGYIALGVLMLSGSSFLAMLISIIAAIVGIVTVLIAGSKAGAFVASGGMERSIKSAGDFVRGFFKKSAASSVA